MQQTQPEEPEISQTRVTMPSEDTGKPPRSPPFRTNRVVKPQVMCLDGHWFRINQDVPQEVTDRLHELVAQSKTYEDVTDDLKEYEVDHPSQVKVDPKYEYIQEDDGSLRLVTDAERAAFEKKPRK